MSRRILDVSNLVEVIENKMISVISVENKVKACSDITATDNVTPKKFIESLQYLNEAKLFRNGIDFYYEFTGKNGIHIDVAMKNPYLDEYFYVECAINDGVSIDDVDKKFKETVFDRVEQKIAV
ncbi:MAG: hypothetical protein HDQ99_05765 [Lachnospiraceae bacterium]|nr:hypothetical protein [Lachnospiraceae bacterium]